MLTYSWVCNHGQAAAASAKTTAKMALDRVSHKTKIDVFENAFRKIKEVSEKRVRQIFRSKTTGRPDKPAVDSAAGPRFLETSSHDT